MDIEEVVMLFKEADKSQRDSGRHAVIDRLLAEKVMGWHTVADDQRRLWRDAKGNPVQWDMNGKIVNLCEHPYRRDVNKDDDNSFDPAFNYHPNITDWRQVVLDKLIKS